jgi:hypothetical protein
MNHQNTNRHGRRAFLALALALLPLASPVRAAPGDDPARTDPRLKLATDLLTRGIRFERAAEILRDVVRDHPGSVTARLALACACVSRVASLAYAGGFYETLLLERDTYPERLQKWERARANPEARTEDDDTPTEKPTPPPDFTVLIKDDQTAYRLTRDELKGRVGALRAEALAGLDAATEKAGADPEARAEADYYRGWCLWLLTYYYELPNVGLLIGEGIGGMTFSLYPAPDMKEIIACFARAAEARPEDAGYWRALGDARRATGAAEADGAYLRSLDLSPRQATLWYRLFSTEMLRATPPDPDEEGDGPKKPRRPHSPEDARHYLKQAAWADPGNAFYLYEQASLLLKQETKFEPYSYSTNRAEDVKPLRNADAERAAGEAVALTERGNATATMTFPVYRHAPPRWLAVAHSYFEWPLLELPWYARLRALARALCGVAIFAANERRDAPGAKRACRAAIGLGLRLVGDGETTTGDKNFRTLDVLVGVAIAAIAYKGLIEAVKVAGTPGDVEAVEKEEAEFRARAAAAKERIKENLKTEHYTAYY